MFHLFKHEKGKLKGKYDFAFVANGNFICGSPQGNDNRIDVLKAIKSIAKHTGGINTLVQDDTFEKSVVFNLTWNKNKIITYLTKKKPRTKYEPK